MEHYGKVTSVSETCISLEFFTRNKMVRAKQNLPFGEKMFSKNRNKA